MAETKEQVRKQTYEATKEAFLAGTLTNGAAAQALLRGYWSVEEAGMAVAAWRQMTNGRGAS
jgi:hypothetical protein